MKRFLFSLTFILFALFVKAQTLEGIAVDAATEETLPYATVRLFASSTPRNDEAHPIKAVTTDAEGRFRIEAPQDGDYRLLLSYFGYETKELPLTLKAAEVTNLGMVKMTEAESKTLKTATVAAQRLLVKADIDKMTYEMKEDPDAQSSTLLDMLRKVPMVTVDGDDKIQVNGSASFKVYVNGKPNQMLSSNPSMIMKNFPASTVKRVEVITNPGAKYDAEGVAGVLNIITEENAETSGWTVTPNLMAGNKHQMGSLFAMVQYGKFTLSADYGIGRHHNGDVESYSMMHNYAAPLSHYYRAAGSSEDSGLFQFGMLDASYEFDSKNLLSVSVGLNGYNGKELENTRADLFTKGRYEALANCYGDLHTVELPTEERGDYYGYNLRGDQRMKQFSVNTSVDYQHTFAKEGQNLTLSYRMNYNPTRDKRENIYTSFTPSALQKTMPDGLFDQRSDPRNKSDEHTFQIDYAHPFGANGKAGTLSVGGKYILRLNSTNSMVETSEYEQLGDKPAFTVDEERSIVYNHRGDVAAAYAEYEYRLGKFGLQAGGRYEHYHMEAKYPKNPAANFSTNIPDFVPSVLLSYNIKPTMMVKAGYNARVGRPDITMLSPYREWKSAETLAYGNPELASERAHNVNATFSTFSQKFTLNTTLTYSHSDNGLTSYSFIDNSRDNGNALHITTYGEFLHQRSVTLNVFMNWMFTKTTTLNLNATGGYKRLYAQYEDVLDNDQRGWTGNLFAGLVQRLPWKLRAQLWAGGSTKDVMLMGRGPAFYFYSLNLSRTFLRDDRLTLTLRASNFICGKQRFSQAQDSPFYYGYGYARFDLSNIGLSVQWRLGSLKTSVKKAARTINNDDFRQGQSNDRSVGGATGAPTGTSSAM